MSTLSLSSPRPETRVLLFAAAALVFLGSWALLHTHHFTAHRLVDTPIYESYGERSATARSRTATSRSSTRRARCRSSSRRPSPATTPRTFGWLMAALGVSLPRARRAGGSAVVVGRVRRGVAAPARRTSRSAATTSGRPRCSRRRSRRCSRTGTGSAGGCSALRSRRSSTRSWSCRSGRRGRCAGGAAASWRGAPDRGRLAAVVFVPFLAVAPRRDVGQRRGASSRGRSRSRASPRRPDHVRHSR